jgi:metallo-beta-lactamase class B
LRALTPAPFVRTIAWLRHAAAQEGASMASRIGFVAACFASLIAAHALAQSTTASQYEKPFPPHKVVGNVYFVGTAGLSNFLITTPEGHILINSDLESTVPIVRRNIEQLGFKFSDVKILLINHAHFDHNAGSALVKELTGAKYMVMDADVPLVEQGAKLDFQYADDPQAQFRITKVDRVLHDGDTVQLGGSELVAHLTPGHTKGCTTWTLRATEDGKTYDVTIVGSANVNAGYQLVNNAKYPTIAQDYEKTFRVLASLPTDIFLGAHPNYYGLEAKYARLDQGKPRPGQANAFADAEGYRAFVSDREQAFRAELKRQRDQTK